MILKMEILPAVFLAMEKSPAALLEKGGGSPTPAKITPIPRNPDARFPWNVNPHKVRQHSAANGTSYCISPLEAMRDKYRHNFLSGQGLLGMLHHSPMRSKGHMPARKPVVSTRPEGPCTFPRNQKMEIEKEGGGWSET